MSVKLRITLWYTLFMIIVSAIAVLAMNSFGSRMIENDTQRRVMRTVDDMSKNFVDRGGNLRRVPEFMFFHEGVYIVIYDENNSIVGGNVPFGITEALDIEDGNFRKTSHGTINCYEFDKEVFSNQGKFFIKGISTAADEMYGMRSLTKNNIILTAITILIAAIGGYFIISRALLPVKKISEAAEEISQSNDLTRRINIGTQSKDEIYALANTVDKMLDKIEGSFEKEKQFTSDASHELRTPVAVIMSECEYMEECAKTTDDYKESMDSIKRQAQRMSKLISELLTISRMDKDTIKTSFEDVDISELVTFVCDEQEEIHEADISLVRNIGQGIIANADRFLLTRMFVNLISNAYQYIGEGDRIEVSLSEKEENIVFSVKDNGIGISEENIPKIWERFYQADSSRNDSTSMGLGLSMVKWISDAHGGKMEVKSCEGEGSEFIFTMPKKKAV